MAAVGKAQGWRELSIKAPKTGCGQAIEYSLHESRSNITVRAPVTTLRRTVEFLQGRNFISAKRGVCLLILFCFTVLEMF